MELILRSNTGSRGGTGLTVLGAGIQLLILSDKRQGLKILIQLCYCPFKLDTDPSYVCGVNVIEDIQFNARVLSPVIEFDLPY